MRVEALICDECAEELDGAAIFDKLMCVITSACSWCLNSVHMTLQNWTAIFGSHSVCQK